jgi:hypothetical protein
MHDSYTTNAISIHILSMSPSSLSMVTSEKKGVRGDEDSGILLRPLFPAEQEIWRHFNQNSCGNLTGIPVRL